MPPPPSPKASTDPTKSTGVAGDPVLPCETNDIEVVSDLDEPNGLELAIAVEELKPVELLFTASATEPDGNVVALRVATDEADAL